MEWYGAMGLMITLVWLYIEFLDYYLKFRVEIKYLFIINYKSPKVFWRFLF